MTQRQANFAREYIVTGNASEAYRRAYPRSTRWKPDAVTQSASRLLALPHVAARVDDLRARTESEAIATRAEVMEMLTRVVRARPSELLDEGGGIDLDRLRAMRQEVQEVVVEETPLGGRRYKVKLRDAIAAADRLAKLEGWDSPTKLDVNLPRLDYSPTREA